MSSEQHHDHGAEVANHHGLERSGHWRHVRQTILDSQLAAWKRKFPDFDKIYAGVEWEVHHRIAFHFGALLGMGYIELDPRNLVVSPRHPLDLHLFLGHLDDFHSFNIDVLAFLKRWGGELWGGQGSFMTAPDAVGSITADPAWQRAHLGRPRKWDDMTSHDKAALAHLIRTELPLVHQEAA